MRGPAHSSRANARQTSRRTACTWRRPLTAHDARPGPWRARGLRVQAIDAQALPIASRQVGRWIMLFDVLVENLRRVGIERIVVVQRGADSLGDLEGLLRNYQSGGLEIMRFDWVGFSVFKAVEGAAEFRDRHLGYGAASSAASAAKSRSMRPSITRGLDASHSARLQKLCGHTPSSTKR